MTEELKEPKELTLNEAMLEVQKEIPIIAKKTEGYGYKYAELSDILAVVKPILNRYGIEIVFDNSVDVDHSLMFNTVTFIKGDEQRKSGGLPIPIPLEAGNKKTNIYQMIGSAKTYANRYSLVSALALEVADDDAQMLSNQQQYINDKQYTMMMKKLEAFAKAKQTDMTSVINWAKQALNVNDLNKITTVELNTLLNNLK